MSIRRIARDLKVAPSTVSKVMNRYEGFSIRDDLRRRIEARARELNYVPNPVYRAMRQKDNRHICVFLPNFLADTTDADNVRGIDRLTGKLIEEGFTFHYLSRPAEHCRTLGLPLWKSGGAVAVDVRVAEQLVELDASDIPYVVFNGVAGPRGTAVMVDEAATMRRAWEHLTGLGHRRIGYVNYYREPELVDIPFEASHYSVPHRTAAYAACCREIGFEPAPECLDIAHTPGQSVDAGLARGCTAFVAYSLAYALAAIKRIRGRGLRVPEDVSVMNFNNYHLTELVDPPMTVVDMPVEDMGGEAADILIQKYRDPKHAAGEKRLFVGTVIARASTAPARAD